MVAAVERIVVQVTALDKKAIAARAKKFDLPVAELMRRGAFAYEPSETQDELRRLADAAKQAADRAASAMDEALDFIAASNKRIAVMEGKAAKLLDRKTSSWA